MTVNLNIFSSFADLGKILSLDIVIFHIFVYKVVIQMNWECVWKLTRYSTVTTMEMPSRAVANLWKSFGAHE